MSRKFRLMAENDRLFRLARQGAASTRAARKREIRQMINDLVHFVPRSLNVINEQHIDKLVTYWKNQRLALNTMHNKLSRIRTFFKITLPHIAVPTNKTLGIKPHRPSQTIFPAYDLEEVLQQVQHPFTHSILAFQLYFGLTKLEAVRINLNYTLQKDRLFIDRALASNGKDRYVPILNIQQQQALQKRQHLLQGQETFTKIVPEPTLLALYKADLRIKKLDPQFPYRQHYAKKRFDHLSHNRDNTTVIQQLQAELGITSKHRLIKLL